MKEKREKGECRKEKEKKGKTPSSLCVSSLFLAPQANRGMCPHSYKHFLPSPHIIPFPDSFSINSEPHTKIVYSSLLSRSPSPSPPQPQNPHAPQTNAPNPLLATSFATASPLLTLLPSASLTTLIPLTSTLIHPS